MKDIEYAMIMLESFEKETGIKPILEEKGLSFLKKDEEVLPPNMFGSKDAFPKAPFDCYMFTFKRSKSYSQFVNWMGNRKVKGFLRIINNQCCVVVRAESVLSFSPDTKKEKYRGATNARKFGIL
jgi:hypothetical protein